MCQTDLYQIGRGCFVRVVNPVPLIANSFRGALKRLAGVYQRFFLFVTPIVLECAQEFLLRAREVFLTQNGKSRDYGFR